MSSEKPIQQQPPPYSSGSYTNEGFNAQYGQNFGNNPIQMQPVAGSFQTAPATGVEMLANLQKIHVHQEVHLVEVFTSWDRQNRYSVCNEAEQQIFYAREESECCERQCCGILRSMTMNINQVTTSGEIPAIVLRRPLNCQGCCCPCCLQVMEVECPPGQVVATIKEKWTCCIPEYEIFDSQGSHIFSIVGDCCVCKCCTDVHFRVLRGSQEVADIQKHWGGCREVCGQANDFSLIFHDKAESVMNKSILLGATFLIDFNYFEKKNSN